MNQCKVTNFTFNTFYSLVYLDVLCHYLQEIFFGWEIFLVNNDIKHQDKGMSVKSIISSDNNYGKYY